MLWIITGIIISYLIGSIPTAYIWGKVLKGIDIRKFGSGNIGATNALRVLGKKAGIAVLAIDVLKGFAPLVVIGSFIIPKAGAFPAATLFVALGLSCVIGHVWTVFLGFKGGKGMATGLGILIGLSVKIPGLYIVLLSVVLLWILVFIGSRIVSLASLVSAVSLPILMLVFRQEQALIILSLILSALAIFRHKSNLIRVFQGKEKPLF